MYEKCLNEKKLKYDQDTDKLIDCYVNSMLPGFSKKIPIQIVDVMVELGYEKRAIDISDTFSDKIKRIGSYMLVYKKFYKQKKYRDILKKVIDILVNLDSDGLKVSLLVDISIDLFKIGAKQRSSELLEQSINIAVNCSNARMLSGIAIELAEADNIDLLEKATGIAESIENKYEQIRAFIEIANELARIKKNDRSINLLNKTFDRIFHINDKEERVKILIAIAHAFTKNKAMEKSFDLLDIAIKDINSFSDPEIQALILIEIATEFANIGEFSKAIDLFKKTADIAQKLIFYLKTSLFIRITSEVAQITALEFAKMDKLDISVGIAKLDPSIYDEFLSQKKLPKNQTMKQLDKAVDLLRKINNIKNYESPDNVFGEYETFAILKKIATELVKINKMPEAIDVVNNISDTYKKASAFKDMAIEAHKKCKMEEAAKLLEISVNFTEEIFDRYNKINLLKEVAAKFVLIGKIDKAINLLEKAVNTVNNIFEYSERFNSLQILGVEFLKIGKIERNKSLLLKSLSLLNESIHLK